MYRLKVQHILYLIAVVFGVIGFLNFQSSMRTSSYEKVSGYITDVEETSELTKAGYKPRYNYIIHWFRDGEEYQRAVYEALSEPDESATEFWASLDNTDAIASEPAGIRTEAYLNWLVAALSAILGGMIDARNTRKMGKNRSRRRDERENAQILWSVVAFCMAIGVDITGFSLWTYLISTVIVSYIVYGFLNTQNGFINNSILEPLGKNGIAWYSQPKYWPLIITFVYLWKNFGYSSIIYFATVVGIDKTYYEAAVIDGATRWQQVRYVTLSSLKPTIITLVLMSIGRIFYSDFGLFYQVPMNSGALIDVTNTIDTYVYRGLTTLNNVGMSAAAGFYQSIVGFILVLTANMIVRKVSRENALF